MSPSPPTSRPYSPDLPIRPSSITPLNESTHHARFLHTPGGSPSVRHQSFPPKQHAASLSRHRSDPNIRLVAAQPEALRCPSSNATEIRHQQRQQRRQSFHSVTPSSPADRRPSTAGSAASSGGEPRGEAPQEVTAVTPSQYLPPITAGDRNASPDHSAFSDPFSEHNVATRSRSSRIVGVDTLHSETARARMHSPASSRVPIARSVASEEEDDAVPPDPAVSKTYSFVSLPGNAVRKRPRRRYDEIERLYHCSWSGCTKSFGTLNHLNAHIVMQRHGSKRTPAEFKELRKQWRKAKKDESERIARSEERFNMGSLQAALPPSQPYERQPMHQSQGRQQLYVLGMPGPETDQQLAVGEAVSRYPLSPETSSMRPQPPQQYGYDAARSLYPIVPATPNSSWPE